SEEASQYPGMEAGALLPMLLTAQKLADKTKLQDEAQAKQKTIQGLLEKATLVAAQYPNETAFAVLQRLSDADLAPEEKPVRDALLKDDNLKKFTEIAAEPDMKKRGEAYAAVLKDKTMEKAGYVQSQAWLGQMLISGKIPDENAYFPALPAGAPTPPEQANQQKL